MARALEPQAALKVALQGLGLSGRLNTAFIERVNLIVRPHASLRVALVQPRERGGKLLAQRYRWRNETGSVRQLWQREEPTDGGQCRKCYLFHYR